MLDQSRLAGHRFKRDRPGRALPTQWDHVGFPLPSARANVQSSVDVGGGVSIRNLGRWAYSGWQLPAVVKKLDSSLAAVVALRKRAVPALLRFGSEPEILLQLISAQWIIPAI